MSTRQRDLTDAFHPSFTGGRQEQAWILEALGGFYVEEWFTEILYRVKGGKEATVYCCRAHPATGLDLIAAKVFRPTMFRAMRNDSLYRQGRESLTPEGKADRRSRTARAVAKRTRFGKLVDSISWCQHEVRTLETLYEAGADVPRPLTSSTNAILMEFVGDERGAAPILHGIALPLAEARQLLSRLLVNIEVMLSRYLVHADLSAYNVLYHDGEIRIIDLPQAVDALNHPRAYELFQRDLHHVCRYFARQGVEADAYALAHEMWSQRFA